MSENKKFKYLMFRKGRDENVSKMDVDSVDRRPERRPVEKISLVDIDQLTNVRMVDVDQ